MSHFYVYVYVCISIFLCDGPLLKVWSPCSATSTRDSRRSTQRCSSCSSRWTPAESRPIKDVLYQGMSTTDPPVRVVPITARSTSPTTPRSHCRTHRSTRACSVASVQGGWCEARTRGAVHTTAVGKERAEGNWKGADALPICDGRASTTCLSTSPTNRHLTTSSDHRP